MYVEKGAVQYVLTHSDWLLVMDHADNRRNAMMYVSNLTTSVSEPKLNGGLPVGLGSLVLAGQRQTSSVLADQVDLTLQVYNRWSSLRGAE